jgi:hypothetical protein
MHGELRLKIKHLLFVMPVEISKYLNMAVIINKEEMPQWKQVKY